MYSSTSTSLITPVTRGASFFITFPILKDANKINTTCKAATTIKHNSLIREVWNCSGLFIVHVETCDHQKVNDEQKS